MQHAGPVAIVGAGIAGLTAALCLARQGFETEIFEQADSLKEVGAGLQLSPNASRVLIDLGLLPALEAVWSEPDSVALLDGRSLRSLASVPAASFARNRWAAPYGVLHRASLQKILLDAVAAEPRCRVHLGFRIESDPEAAIDRAMARRPSVIVGADGIWSRTRTSIAGAGPVQFSGNIAWRLMVPRAEVTAPLSEDRVTAFLGANAHLVAYPIKEVGAFNLVAIVEGKAGDSVWIGKDSEERRRELAAAFDGWHPKLRALLTNATAASYWPLCTVGDGAWHDGTRTILIGDAAHAMTPFAAQGAAMAIEDARELARCLAESQDVPSAFAGFDRARRSRIDRVRKRAAFNRFAYHARGPVRLGRDLVLALKGPESLAADFDWLYGYGAPER
ncbi:FAD-dependent monooxygenase [Sinorhizobium chiapasense]|uniref:FAD-dependent monooxygenase n=1 Tax=Sinorhizobium chiapasense TaxID=501572 RepID=A0ABZ2BDH6_9HYPH